MPRLLGVTTESADGSDEARQQDGMWTRYSNFTRVYLVLADSLSDNESTILATTGIPPLLYPLQSCFCKRRQPRERNQITHPITGVLTALWEVSCEFDSQYNPQENQQQEDPTALRPEWEWDGEEREVPLEKDAITGDPVETKASEKLIVPTYVHILICFLAYVLWKTLEQWSRTSGLGSTPCTLLDEVRRVKSMDVILPTEQGWEARLRCVSRPEDPLSVLLYRLHIVPPEWLHPPLAGHLRRPPSPHLPSPPCSHSNWT